MMGLDAWGSWVPLRKGPPHAQAHNQFVEGRRTRKEAWIKTGGKSSKATAAILERTEKGTSP